MRNKEIATIIRQQLYTLNGMFMCGIGTNSMAVIENGLQFKVNGAKHKGMVQIRLNGNDLYDFTFIKQSRKLNKEIFAATEMRIYTPITKIIKEVKDIFAEEMIEILDQYAY